MDDCSQDKWERGSLPWDAASQGSIMILQEEAEDSSLQNLISMTIHLTCVAIFVVNLQPHVQLLLQLPISSRKTVY